MYQTVNEQCGVNALKKLSVEEMARRVVWNRSICEQIIQQMEPLVLFAHQAPEWIGALTQQAQTGVQTGRIP